MFMSMYNSRSFLGGSCHSRARECFCFVVDIPSMPFLIFVMNVEIQGVQERELKEWFMNCDCLETALRFKPEQG